MSDQANARRRELSTSGNTFYLLRQWLDGLDGSCGLATKAIVMYSSGTQVPAYHFRQERTMSGSRHGMHTTDLWFARKDGLPLRNVRSQMVRADTVVSTST